MIFQTEEQKDILSINIEDKIKNILVIEALAGTGKTTILLELIKKYKNKKFLYLSFGKENSENVKEKGKLLKNVDIYNVHSLARKKTYKIFENKILIKELDINELSLLLNIQNFEMIYKIKNEFNSFCKQTLNLDDFIENRKMEIKNKKCKIFNTVKEYIFIQLNLNKLYNYFFNGILNYITHDIYLKYFIDNIKSFKLDKKYDIILIDESQDLNSIMFNIVIEFIDKNKFTVCVGDTEQSIFSFINNINILKVLQKEEKYKNRIIIKKLTHSFRFSNSSEIEKFSNLILNFKNKNIIGNANHINTLTQNILYLSRTNKSIFDKISEWVNLGKRFNLIGGINSFNIENITDIFNLIINKIDLIKNKYLKEFAKLDNPIEKLIETALKEENFELLSDIKIARKIYKDGSNPDITFKSIKKMIDENSNEYISTIHKSKGLDFDKVVLVNNNMWKETFFLSFKESKNPVKTYNSILHDNKIYKLLVLNNEEININEEYNLLYVGLTRAKKEILIQDPKYFECLKLLKNWNNIQYANIHYIDKYEDFYLFSEGKENYAISKNELEEFKMLLNQ